MAENCCVWTGRAGGAIRGAYLPLAFCRISAHNCSRFAAFLLVMCKWWCIFACVNMIAGWAGVQAELEARENEERAVKKGKAKPTEKEQHLTDLIMNNNWHIAHLEQILRLLENDQALP